jgi:coenzyme F420 hydrogenase subunit beta
MEAGTFVPLLKPSKGFEELKRLVIDAGMCSLCGSCAAFCERVEMGPEGPFLTEDCNLTIGGIRCSDEGNCLDNCPHVSFSWKELEEAAFGVAGEDPVLGSYRKILGARSRKKEVLEKAQDGGAVTALLQCALSEGLLDGAVVATRSETWETRPAVLTAPEELPAAGGTKYATTPTPQTFGRALREVRRLGIVGTGCQTTGARRFQETVLKEAIERTKSSERPLDLLLIGLFCFENFPYPKLKEVVEREFGVPFKEVVKTDIRRGKFIITKRDGSTDKRPVKAFQEAVQEACEVCPNFTARFADLSVGSVGTKEGWSTVLVRSEKGERLLDLAVEKGFLEVTDQVDIEEIKKIDSFKEKKREEARTRREKEGLYLPDYRGEG